MRMILVSAAVLFMATGTAAKGSHAVSGYVTKSGTVVAPHRQTNPDSSRANNWSTKGNTNPITGQDGTKPLIAPPKPK